MFMKVSKRARERKTEREKRKGSIERDSVKKKKDRKKTKCVSPQMDQNKNPPFFILLFFLHNLIY